MKAWTVVLVGGLLSSACSGKKKIPPPPDWGDVGVNKSALDFAWIKYQQGDPEGAEFLATAYQAGMFGLKQNPQKAQDFFDAEKKLRQSH